MCSLGVVWVVNRICFMKALTLKYISGIERTNNNPRWSYKTNSTVHMFTST